MLLYWLSVPYFATMAPDEINKQLFNPLIHCFDGLGNTIRTCTSFESSSTTLARAGRGGSMRPPNEFFWNGFRTSGRIALKFCLAYWSSLAQPLAKHDLVRSGHGAMTSQ